MATVWAARTFGAHGFQKLVALKTMLPHLASDDEFRRMFLDEARVVSRLEHPNVVQVLDLGEEGGLLYLAMEYVDGESIQTVARSAFRRGNMPIDIVLRVVAEACQGLHAAHELQTTTGSALGLVHRDISPHNLLLSYRGHVKVADFGIAKATERLTDETSLGVRKGKLLFMSPEQVRSTALDRRTDIFALGVTLYQLVTGTNPFRGASDLETMTNVCDLVPPPPSTLSIQALPAGLDAIVMQAMAKDPAARFATAAALGAALDELLLGERAVVRADRIAAWLERECGMTGARRRSAVRDAMELEQGPRGPHPTALADAVEVDDPTVTSRSVPQAGARVVRAPRRAVIVACAAAAVTVLASGGLVGRRMLLVDGPPLPPAALPFSVSSGPPALGEASSAAEVEPSSSPTTPSSVPPAPLESGPSASGAKGLTPGPAKTSARPAGPTRPGPTIRKQSSAPVASGGDPLLNSGLR